MQKSGAPIARSVDVPDRITAGGWRIVLLASLGGTLEFYDFVIFGVFARDIGQAVFPRFHPYRARRDVLVDVEHRLRGRVLRPQPLRPAEVGDPGRGGDPGSGQYGDALGVDHASDGNPLVELAFHSGASHSGASTDITIESTHSPSQ